MANRPDSRLSGLDYSAANFQTESTEDYYYEAQHNTGDAKPPAQDGNANSYEAKD